jgi:hypothetical protein
MNLDTERVRSHLNYSGCKEWHNDSITEIKKLKDEKMKKLLLRLFNTLWINKCHDWDIIWYEFAGQLEYEGLLRRKKHGKQNRI